MNDWLKLATSELRSTTKCMRWGDATLKSAAYLTHQAAEHALKAFLGDSRIYLRKMHDLEKLLAECIAINPTFSVLQEQVHHLNPYFACTYPNDLPPITNKDVKIARQEAQEIYNHVVIHSHFAIDYLSMKNSK